MDHRQPSPTVRALGLAALVVLAACSSKGSSENPQVALKAAKQRLDSTTGVHFVITNSPVGSGGAALENAEGDAKPPSSFAGNATVHTGGITAKVKVVSVDGTVYVKLPLTLGFTKVDPKELGIVDPGSLLAPDTGLSTFLTADPKARADGSTRVDGEVLARYRATLPTIGVLSQSGKDIAAEFDLTKDSHELRRVVLVGHVFDASAISTVTLTLTDYGKTVDIHAP